VDTVNPPDNIYVGVGKGPVSLISRIERFRAVYVFSKVTGVVQERVPR